MTPHADEPIHQPVLLAETVGWLRPRSGGVYCDATLGFGGHAEAVLRASAPDGRLIGLDRDADALSEARNLLAGFGARATLVHAAFSSLRAQLDLLGVGRLDGCMVDLGVSSAQLDRAERGFSFRRDGPLDMRMDQGRGESAAELLARIDEGELVTVLRDFGEERFARAIARAIVAERAQRPITTTGRLAALVSRSVPHRERHKDPATRTFQALRIAVNHELDELRAFLADAPGCLAIGGRLVVISFHSLEDRLAKHAFRALAVRKGEPGYRRDENADVEEDERGTDVEGEERRGPPGERGKAVEDGPGGPQGSLRLRILTKHIVVASDEERAANPRARSAKLRAVERVS